MEESIKINKLEIENVKRVKAVKVEPNKNGLTVIGGENICIRCNHMGIRRRPL